MQQVCATAAAAAAAASNRAMLAGRGLRCGNQGLRSTVASLPPERRSLQLQCRGKLRLGCRHYTTSSHERAVIACATMTTRVGAWRGHACGASMTAVRPNGLLPLWRGVALSTRSAQETRPDRSEQEEFIRKNLHLLAQRAFFFEDETWEILGIHHDAATDRTHVEAIPEDAEYIGFPAFRFVFSFDPEVAKCRDEGKYDAFGPEDDELIARISRLEQAKGLTASCLGCYAFSNEDGTFFLLAPGVLGEEAVEAECVPLFYAPPSAATQ